MADHRITCPVCAGAHLVDLKDAQAKATEPFVFACPDLDRRYRLTSFYVDSRRGLFRQESGVGRQYAENQQAALREELGSLNFDEKCKRWLEIDYPPIGLIDEYPTKIAEIINSYSMGNWYPAVTSSCCLAERILNRLVLRCREHFKGHPKYIYLVFDVPGEVWVRSEAEALPFVREFVLPHCYRAHAVHEVDLAARRIIERLGKVGPLSDAEFVNLRKDSQAAAAQNSA